MTETLGWQAQLKRLLTPKARPTKSATRSTSPKPAAAAPEPIPAAVAAQAPAPAPAPKPPMYTQRQLDDAVARVDAILAKDKAMKTSPTTVRIDALAPTKNIGLSNGSFVTSPTRLPAGTTIQRAADPFAPATTWAGKFAAALSDVGTKLDTTGEVVTLVRNGKSFAVDTVLYTFKSFLTSQRYTPAADVFEAMCRTVVVDVCSLLPTTSPLLP